VREAAAGPDIRVPAAAADPTAARSVTALRQRIAHHARNLVGRDGSGRVHLHRAEGQLDEVDVALGEAGQQQAAREVNHLGLRPAQVGQLNRSADGQDAPLAHGDGLGPARAGRVGGVDGAAGKEQVSVERVGGHHSFPTIRS